MGNPFSFSCKISSICAVIAEGAARSRARRSGCKARAITSTVLRLGGDGADRSARGMPDKGTEAGGETGSAGGTGLAAGLAAGTWMRLSIWAGSTTGFSWRGSRRPRDSHAQGQNRRLIRSGQR